MDCKQMDGSECLDCATQQFSSFLHDKNCPETLISNEIKDILVTSNGDVWIATNKGLVYTTLAIHSLYTIIHQQFLIFLQMTL